MLLVGPGCRWRLHRQIRAVVGPRCPWQQAGCPRDRGCRGSHRRPARQAWCRYGPGRIEPGLSGKRDRARRQPCRERRAEHLTVHELSETTADATEGTSVGIGTNWERCRYDWSEPGRVTATVTGSNVYAHPGSSWQLTATPSDRGSRVEMVWQRTFRRNPRGLLFGTLFRIAWPPDLRPLRAAGHRQPRGART